MPKRNGNIYCVNHSEQEMVRVEGFSALTKIEKDHDKVLFFPTSGLPLIVYICEECGYIELYGAQGSDAWEES